jgi:hypothetical protein
MELGFVLFALPLNTDIEKALENLEIELIFSVITTLLKFCETN